MATKEETKMYDLAVERVKDLEKSLSEANGDAEVQEKERRMEAALSRLETLSKIDKADKSKIPEKEEEEDDQCPNCGTVLEECEDGTFYCSNCCNYFEDDE